MAGLNELRVSLTKNGFFKVAEIIKNYPRDQILKNHFMPKIRFIHLPIINRVTFWNLCYRTINDI